MNKFIAVVMFFALVCVLGNLLYLLYVRIRYGKGSLSKKKVLPLFGYIVIFIIGMIIYEPTNKNDSTPIQQNTKVQQTTETLEKEQSKQLAPEIQTITDVTGMNEEQAQNLNDILLQCGIDKYSIRADSSMDNLHGLNEKSYVIGYKNKPEIIMLLLPDNSIYRIICKGKYLYNGDTGKVERTIDEIKTRHTPKESTLHRIMNE